MYLIFFRAEVRCQQPFRSKYTTFLLSQMRDRCTIGTTSDQIQKLMEPHTQTRCCLHPARQVLLACRSHQIPSSTETSAWHSQTVVLTFPVYAPWSADPRVVSAGCFSGISSRMILVVPQHWTGWLIWHIRQQAKMLLKDTFLLSSGVLWHELYHPETNFSLSSWSSVG